MNPEKNSIIIDGTVYAVVRNNCLCGMEPDPCTLCDLRRRCQAKDNAEPCRIFNKGHFLAHFKKPVTKK